MILYITTLSSRPSFLPSPTHPWLRQCQVFLQESHPDPVTMISYTPRKHEMKLTGPWNVFLPYKTQYPVRKMAKMPMTAET